MSPATMAWGEILEEHGSEAAFLFELRSRAFVSYRQTLDSLAFLDERLLAHLDGLEVATSQSWELLAAGLGSDQAGEAFVSAWLALGMEGDGWKAPLEAALAEPASPAGLSGALRLARGPAIEARLQHLATRDPLPTRALAHDALAFRGKPVAPAVARTLLTGDDPVARMAGVNIAARLRLRELANPIAAVCDDPAEWLAVRALQALALLDDREAAARARALAPREDRAGGAALRLLGAIGTAADATFLTERAAGGHAREALLALGRLGDPAGIEPILAACEDPKRARAAGHAFEILSGARLERDRLSRNEPPPSPEEEEKLEIDPDDGLAWPEASRVRDWWESRSQKPRRGARWRAGAAFDWEAVAAEAADEFLPLPDRDDVLMELAARLTLDHAERRDWATGLRAATPGVAEVRRQARKLEAGPWPAGPR